MTAIHNADMSLHKAVCGSFAVISICIRVMLILFCVLAFALLPDEIRETDALFLSFLLTASSADIALSCILLKNRHVRRGAMLGFVRRLAERVYRFALCSRIAETACFVMYYLSSERDPVFLLLIFADVIFAVFSIFILRWYSARRRIFGGLAAESIPGGDTNTAVPTELHTEPVKRPSGFRSFVNAIKNIIVWLVLLAAAIFAWVMIDNARDSRKYELYTEEALYSWLDETWQEKKKHSETVFSAGTGKETDYDQSTIDSCLEKYFEEIQKDSLRYSFEVETWNVYSCLEAGHITVFADFTYYPDAEFGALDTYGTAAEALAGLSERLRDGESAMWFLVPEDWTQVDIELIARELCDNDVHTAAEWESFFRYTSEIAENGLRLASIEKVYDIDEAYLKECTAEMEARLDEIAGEIRAGGISDTRQLYRAAAKAVIEAAEYDDDTRISSLTDNLSDSEKVDRSAYGAVITGRTVCTGYAYAFKALCDKLDLYCWVVSGYNGDGKHAWNRIGDGLYVDCTFCDTGYTDLYMFMDEDSLEEYEYYISANQIYPENAA